MRMLDRGRWSPGGAIRGAGLALLILSCAGLARAGDEFDPQQLSSFISEMVAEHGFGEAQLREVLGQARLSRDVLAKISRPAEAKPWHEYRLIFLTDKRVAEGVEFWRSNADTLDQAAARYGVAPEVMVAIIGVETFYGRLSGGHRVLDALATLAFDYPRRASFFRGELESFLLLTRAQGVDPLSLTGSYAGAMGMPQFMPSSFLAYAVDFDADGHTDIWSDPDDAIGSVGNYLARHGWEPGAPVVAPASIEAGRYRELLSGELKPSTAAGELEGYGVQSLVGLAPETKVTLIELQASATDLEHWLGLQNFYVITRYNRSALYAMAVHQLAEAIRAGHAARGATAQAVGR